MLRIRLLDTPALQQLFKRKENTLLVTYALDYRVDRARPVLSEIIKRWSLTSLQQRLVKTGGRLVKHARYYWLLLAEGHLTRRLFGDMLRRIWALPVPAG